MREPAENAIVGAISTGLNGHFAMLSSMILAIRHALDAAPASLRVAKTMLWLSAATVWISSCAEREMGGSDATRAQSLPSASGLIAPGSAPDEEAVIQVAPIIGTGPQEFEASVTVENPTAEPVRVLSVRPLCG